MKHLAIFVVVIVVGWHAGSSLARRDSSRTPSKSARVTAWRCGRSETGPSLGRDAASRPPTSEAAAAAGEPQGLHAAHTLVLLCVLCGSFGSLWSRLTFIDGGFNEVKQLKAEGEILGDTDLDCIEKKKSGLTLNCIPLFLFICAFNSTLKIPLWPKCLWICLYSHAFTVAYNQLAAW